MLNGSGVLLFPIAFGISHAGRRRPAAVTARRDPLRPAAASSAQDGLAEVRLDRSTSLYIRILRQLREAPGGKRLTQARIFAFSRSNSSAEMTWRSRRSASFASWSAELVGESDAACWT